jgi:hypothetical protein
MRPAAKNGESAPGKKAQSELSFSPLARIRVMFRRIIRQARLILILALALSGCSSKNQPVRVEGIVTLDDRPVEGVMVVFIPEGTISRPASAMTDSEGHFSLTTFKEGDGAIPGDYRVVIKKRDALPEPPAIDASDPKSILAHYKNREDRRKQKSQLPHVYAQEKTTPFHYTVPVNGKVFLELKSSDKK